MDEHQQDANSALIELDKGLRANKVGEQCEAIVRFPGLFKRFPFPILINSAFLKLADTFRTGNNFIRLCILRVAQQSQKHLDKILNIDEFTKRIFIVIHSNDPYARAITLRMLGSVACIIGEKKNAHHSIQQGLDSHDRVEQDASIFATTQFASHSQHFASSICNKIAAMLQGLSTPLEVKLKLIPVLQFMHFDVQVSSKARNILHDLLPSYPAQDFVIITLNTLTQLSLHSLVDIPSQVTLLLQYLRCDPREAVKFNSLHNLNCLAKKAPHLWTLANTSSLCEAFGLSTLSESLKREILEVLCSLTATGSTIQLEIEEGCPILELCRQCCYDLDVVQAALATKLFVALTGQVQHKGSLQLLMEEASEAAETLLMLVAPDCEKLDDAKKAIKIILPAIKGLCKVSSKLDAQVTESVLLLLLDGSIPLPSDTAIFLLQTLTEISLSSLSTDFLLAKQEQILALFQTAVKQDCTDNVTSNLQRVISLLSMLLFMSNWKEMDAAVSKLMLDRLLSSKLNHWVLYRIARQASRLGQHTVAHELFTKISGSVATEYHYFWLVSLSQISMAESFAWSNCQATTLDQIAKRRFLSQINKSIHNYHRAGTSLMAAVTPNHNLVFQCQYIRLRREMLQAHCLLLNACSLIRTCPPPAISAIASEDGSNDGVPSCGGILYTQMKNCAESFMAVNKSYSQLLMTSFDADSSTLANLEILQQSCSIMAYAIDLLILSRSSNPSRKNSNFDSADETDDDDHFTRAMKKVFSKVMGKLENSVQSDNTSLPISHLHTDCLILCSCLMLSVPHSYPRYFYQSLQTTNIKLAITPSQRGGNDPVTVEINQRLALKVEGVVQHSSTSSQEEDAPTTSLVADDTTQRKKLRAVSKIKLVANRTSQGQPRISNGKIDDADSSLEQIVEPHNDYFSTQFILTFPQPGLYNAVVEASVKDSEGVWWKTGPKETILIKAYDDNIRIQQQTAQINARSNLSRS